MELQNQKQPEDEGIIEARKILIQMVKDGIITNHDGPEQKVTTSKGEYSFIVNFEDLTATCVGFNKIG